jgi:hypothetical protein
MSRGRMRRRHPVGTFRGPGRCRNSPRWPGIGLFGENRYGFGAGAARRRCPVLTSAVFFVRFCWLSLASARGEHEPGKFR